ncbi:MAG: peroxiredoxin [Paracoccaceae bacterium]
MLSTGEIAPDFTLPDDAGTPVTLSALRPGKVVIFFYPKASTPACTTEGLDFSARAGDFAKAGTAVLGISRDSIRRQCNFRARNALTIPLLSDENGTVCQDWGVWQEKQLYGKRYMGIVRSTFLIDGAGRVAQVWSDLRVKGHADEVLAAARALA